MADKENDKLLEHAYDGIQEYDNPLPTWWKLTFYATILVVPLYLWDPLGIGLGPDREMAYRQEVAEFTAAHPATTGPALSDERFNAMSKDPAKVAEGKAVFTTNCVACHRPDGGGLIGPNLTDDYWIHGGKPTEINKTINEGVLAKGMPNWGKMLKPAQTEAVTAYVLSIHGSNPSNPKAPDGVKVTPGAVPAAPVGPAGAVKKGR